MSGIPAHRADAATIALRTALLLGFLWLAYGFATTDVLAAKIAWGSLYRPLATFCAVAAALGFSALYFFGRSAAPLVVGIAAFALVAFGPTAFLAAILLLWLAYILGEFVFRTKLEQGSDPTDFFFRIALGLLVLALILNVAIALPVHDVRIYAFVFLLALFFGRRTHRKLAMAVLALARLSRTPLNFWSSVAAVTIGVLVCVQITYAAFPERYHDGLAFHLLIPQVVKTAGQWHFAGDFLSPATQPIAADWLFSVMFVLAGEMGAKLINYFFFLLAALLCFLVALKNYGRTPALAAVLVLLSSPLVFIEAAAVFVDNFLSLAATAALALCALWPKLPPRDRVLSSAVLLGGLPTVKLQGALVSFALLLLLLSRRVWHDVRANDARTIFIAIIALILAAVPILIAFAVTGNPVMPFMNAFFRSPYFPEWNFTGVYAPDPSLGVLHRLTFNTSKHLQAHDGTFGFQFVAFLFTGIVATLARRTFLAVAALTIVLIYGIAVLFLNADARYFYPILPAFSVVIALGIFMLREGDHAAYARAGVAGAVLIASLNFLYFPGAGWILPMFKPVALIDARVREELIAHTVPQRLMVEHINGTHGPDARVVYLGQPVGFPLMGTPIYVNWYMPSVYAGVAAAKTPEDIRRWLASLGATHLMIPTQHEPVPSEEAVRGYLALDGESEMVIGNVALYRIRNEVRFPTVLSSAGSWDRWSLDGASLTAGGLRLQTSRNVGFATPALTSEQRELRVSLKASCENRSAQIAIQVNWQLEGAARQIVESKALPCANGLDGRLDVIFQRPRRAVSAVIYLVKGGEGTALVSDPAVYTTAITLPEPLPLYQRDWSRSPAWSLLKRLRAF